MKLRVAILLVFLWSLSFAVFGQINSSVSGDRQALMDLYEATGGDSWDNNSGWGDGNPSDAWHGVQVDADGRVVRLDLFDNGLQGQLPASIGNLTKLRYLGLKQNQLTGTIPSEIGNLTALEVLALAGRKTDNHGRIYKDVISFTEGDWGIYYHAGKRQSATNKFSGSIPTTIGNLSNLRVIEISGQDEDFGPTIPSEIGNCTALEGIYFSHNHGFTGSIPSSVGNLTNLKHFYMADNYLTGDLPQSISNLTKMTYFAVGSTGSAPTQNSLTGELPDFSGMKDLMGIEVNSNKLTGKLPHYLNDGTHTEMEWFQFSWNDFTGTVPDFDNMPNVFSIGVNGNNLTGGVDWLTTINHGVILVAAGWNDFSGDFPQNWGGKYWNLRIFRLNDTQVTGHIPCDFWDSVGKSDNLKWIYLQNNELDSNATSCMEAVDSPVLEKINVNGNNF